MMYIKNRRSRRYVSTPNIRQYDKYISTLVGWACMHEAVEGCQSYLAATSFCDFVRDRDSEFRIVIQALTPIASGVRYNFF